VLLQDISVLRTLGAEVSVLFPQGACFSTRMANRMLEEGATLQEANLSVLRRTWGWRSVSFPTRIPTAVSKADVVVVWTLAMAPYLVALAPRRVPVVASVHEVLPGFAGSQLARACSLATAVMVNSLATKSWLASHGGRAGQTVLAYPAAPRTRIRTRRSSSDFAVLVAARVNGWKGHAQAIEAVDRMRDEGINANITLAGSPFPGQEPALEELVQASKGRDYVRYVGQVENMDDLFTRADALLIASQRPEPFGLVALEAWAAGTRTVGPAASGAWEAVSLVEGLTYAPCDTESMASQLSRVATTPRLRLSPSGDAPAGRLCTLGAREAAWKTTLARLI
jgi:glycosyltransferase involved in cell wall biosynthesis